MWELDHKEGGALKNWFYWIVVLDKTLESPLGCRRLNQSILKEISPEYSLEGLMLKLKLQCFGHLMGRAGSLEKTLILGKIEGRRKRGKQRMRWLDSISGHEFEQLTRDTGGQNGKACYGPQSHKESDKTQWLNNNMMINLNFRWRSTPKHLYIWLQVWSSWYS